MTSILDGMLLALLLAQADPATVSSKPAANSWSILEPIANEPCRRADAAEEKNDQNIVVCAQPLPSQKLPYPNEVIPKGPKPSNPEMRASGALDAEASPCATRLGGCQVGFGPPIMPIIAGAVDLAKRAFAKKPDKTGREPILLDEPPPPSVILP
ncbi:hypothetical protein [Sphingomonas sp. GB1N7]|uniref:hypothetical protein n=1 Tax=Parasphingomonas caseinilytica TaxID=3096158 RepID=UPI002FC5878A